MALKSFRFPKQNRLQKITLGSIFTVALLLPFSTTFSNIALGGVLITTVIAFFTSGLNPSLFRRKDFYLLSPLLFFLLIFIGTLYSPWDHQTFKEVKRMLFMAVLPFLALRQDLNPQKALKFGAAGLIAGALGSALLLLIINFIKISSEPITWYTVFSYHHTSFNFTAPLGIHPIYLGSYYVMALVFLSLNRFTFPFKKVLITCGAGILLVGILFLNSRMIYGITALISVLLLIKKFRWKGVVLLLIGIVISSFLLLPKMSNTYLFNKLVKGTQWELSQNIGTYNTDQKHPADSRFSRWKVAWELIREQPLWGSGTGTEREKLAQKFKAYKMQVSYASRYNAHNQFIGFTIRFGIFGLLFLLFYFFGNFTRALHKRNLTFICFLLLILGIFLIENYIDRNMGINFVAFFGTLFYMESKPSKPMRYAIAAPAEQLKVY